MPPDLRPDVLGPGDDREPATRPTRAARPTRRRYAAVSGVLAAALTVAVGHLVAGFVGPGSSPVVAVGAVVVDRTPQWLKELAIRAFGTHDKTALFVGLAIVLTGLAAGVGVVAQRSPRAGVLLVLVLGGVGAAAAVSRTDAGGAAFLPSALGAAAGVVALRALGRRLGTLADALDEPVESGPDRRAFLRSAGGVVVLAAVSAAIGSALGSVGRVASAARAAVVLPRAARPAPAVPAGAQSPTPGVVPFVTPNPDFYRIDTALVVPDVDPSTWTLRVHGLVAHEVTLTFAELLASNLVEADVTLTCVSNPVGGDLIGNARWLGLPIRDVLSRAAPDPSADMVLSTSVDGFTASTPLAVLTDGRDALLAVGMNGEPLPLAHGFPVRMVVPGLYGYVSATKWVVDLEVTRFADRTAYWTERGWSPRGPVKTSSRIEVPRPGTVVGPGPVAVGGTAWAQHRGITAVQVRVDDGPWTTVTLAAEDTVDTWRQWSWTWDATPGTHTLAVRATDAVDGVQTGTVTDVVPDGATGWDTIDVTVRA